MNCQILHNENQEPCHLIQKKKSMDESGKKQEKKKKHVDTVGDEQIYDCPIEENHEWPLWNWKTIIIEEKLYMWKRKK